MVGRPLIKSAVILRPGHLTGVFTMRSLILAGLTMVTAIAAIPAEAQRLGPGAPYPYPGQPGAAPGQLPPPPVLQRPGQPYPGQPYPGQPYPGQGQRSMRSGGGQRWGGSIGGQWSGGVNAPGGWNAYRRPSRGHDLPRYWASPSFYIGDFGSYGLQAPPQGYSWHRYYDDAVLLDARGRVYDSVGGVDWDRGDYDDGYAYAEGGQGGYASSSYGYAQGGQGAAGVVYAPPPAIVTQGGYSSTYSSGAGYAGAQSGYAAGGYWYPPATTTIVTIQGAPTVTTTTTTEYVEETTRYVAPRRVYRAVKRHYRAPVRRRCGCRAVEQPVQGS